MESSDQLWQVGTLVVEPVQKGRRHAAEVKDRSGVVRARSADDGTITDETGSLLFRAPLRKKAHSPSDVAIDIADAAGQKLGEASVTGFSYGPRSRRLTLAIRDAAGSELARLEPRDRQGEVLGLTASGSDVATVKVERVKAGLLRKSRVYTVELTSGVSDAIRPLALAGLVRFEAMLQEVERLSVHDD